MSTQYRAASVRKACVASKAIDRDLLIRGAFIALLDIVVFSFMGGRLYLQVLYAIGVSLMLMALLYRLDRRVLLASALILLCGGEAFTVLFWQPHGEGPAVAGTDFCSSFSGIVRGALSSNSLARHHDAGWVFGDWPLNNPARKMPGQ